ncbi:Gfo/Idh/MocA family protein [Halosimplex aquaticum]|uniref:Gfo/Idh/MocA family protein n=1 Tax=Halosimplex aquaticum TaxID=3026162 RepID=A0ABD5Y421_9EURY|nr:Gfo/Idh/MocA family oxidoreductase [Halosimplex aquaticum]
MDDDSPRMDIGLVGLGEHGETHAQFLQELGHTVHAVDLDPRVKERFLDRYDATMYESLDALFEAGLDAVIISTPNKFHETAALKAFDMDLDVLIEKPLAHDLESAERIVEAAEQTGNICMCGYFHRFRNRCKLAKAYVESGRLGEVRHIDARYMRRRGVPGRGTWYTSREIAGGGALIDVGCFLIDLVLDFYDWPELEQVIATAQSDFGNRPDYAYLEMWGDDDEAKMYDVEDAATAFCEFEGGRTAHLEVAWAANARRRHEYNIRGTEAGVSLDITNPLESVEPSNAQVRDFRLYEVRSDVVDHYVDSELIPPVNDPFRDELATFLAAVETGESPDRCTAQQALAVQRVIDSIYEATDHGWV